MAVPWMFLTPTFVPWWSVSPVHPCTQRVPFKTGVGSFSWQGMDWCGGQPGCNRGGALAAQDKSPLFATFGEVKGREGAGRRLPTKGAYTPPPPHLSPTSLPFHPLQLTCAVTGR